MLFRTNNSCSDKEYDGEGEVEVIEAEDAHLTTTNKPPCKKQKTGTRFSHMN